MQADIHGDANRSFTRLRRTCFKIIFSPFLHQQFPSLYFCNLNPLEGILRRDIKDHIHKHCTKMQSQTSGNPDIRRSLPGRILRTCYLLKWHVLGFAVIQLTGLCIAYPHKVCLGFFQELKVHRFEKDHKLSCVKQQGCLQTSRTGILKSFFTISYLFELFKLNM